jgi:hypothetical protein
MVKDFKRLCEAWFFKSLNTSLVSFNRLILTVCMH